jgi:hypothetical protein
MSVKIHKIIILPDFLYGCVTCSLTLRKGHRKDMGRTWEGHGKDAQDYIRTEEGQKSRGRKEMHNEELHDFHSSK